MVTPIEAEGNEYYQGKYKEGMIKGPSHERGGVNMLAVEGDFIYPRKYAKQAKMLRGEITKIEDKMKRLENKLSKVSNPQLAENTYKRSFDKVKDELKYLYEQEEALKQQVVVEKQIKEQEELEAHGMPQELPKDMVSEDMYDEELSLANQMPQQEMPIQEFSMGGDVFGPTYNMFGVKSPLDITRTGALNDQTIFGLRSILPTNRNILNTVQPIPVNQQGFNLKGLDVSGNQSLGTLGELTSPFNNIYGFNKRSPVTPIPINSTSVKQVSNPYIKSPSASKPIDKSKMTYTSPDGKVNPVNFKKAMYNPRSEDFKLPSFQVGDIGVAASSLIPAIYNLYQSRQPIANYNFGRVKPIDYVPLSPEQALREQRLAASTAANLSTRMPAGMRSGMLANLQAGALKGMQDTRFAYDQQNAQNLNQVRQANAQIQQQNIALAMQERQLRDAALAARQQFGATGMSQLGSTLGGVGSAMNQRQQSSDLMDIMQNMGAYFDITVGPDGKPQFSYRKNTPASTD